MNLQMKTVVTLKDLFPLEENNEIEYYLEGIDKKTLLKVGTFFSSFSRNSIYENPIEFIKMYFSRDSNEFMNLVIDRFMSFVEKGEQTISEYSFVYIKSSLSLFEYAFDKNQNKPTEYSIQELDEKLLKAYLLLNQLNISNNTEILIESTSSLSAEYKFVAFSIGLQLNNVELVNYNLYKILFTQILRAISFFEFLSYREDCHHLLLQFYKYYKIDNYKDYINKILPLLISILKKEKESHIDFIFEKNAESDEIISFLEKFTIDDSEELSDLDFRNTRSKPLYRIKERTFRIIYPLFVFELLGNGLYFKLKAINDTLKKEEKVKNLYHIKTYEYSEKYILNKLLKEIFGEKYIQKSGAELDDTIPGAPDYYCRNGKKIFLFESKDIMINASVKQSYDFNIINDELKFKLFKNQKGSSKAVLQLINNIRKILSDSLEFDKGFKTKNVIVYPIIVVHHRLFNTPGINKWVNFWYKKELSKLKVEGLNTLNVRDLTIIDVDTLLFNKEVLSRKLKIEVCLDEYYKKHLNFDLKKQNYKSQEHVNQAQKNSLLSFAEYLENKIEVNNFRGYPFEFINKVKQKLLN